MGATLVPGRGLTSAELFKDFGAVWCESGLDDVVPVGDLLGGVAELGCGVLGVGLLVNQGGDGLAEGVA